ncbi:hypothetical protein K431DRAFT_348352 [Polychaeton citri CBS 116435]|uniref:Uncharacterized protein n=1 Tax=Polychaeton citri CBS 116435 TaxID=1314669 RepID=A0A9P4Q5M1_9PEZI|nr:hypothetical protein K431DRAFT_348352 [Polychaeton citri CBS 116435]
MAQSFPAFDLPDPTSLPRREPTPPAALSSLGLRLKAQEEAGRDIMVTQQRTSREEAAPAGFSDSQYDMLDDISEISSSDIAGTDDAETASIAGSEQDDGSMTPDDTASVIDDREDLHVGHRQHHRSASVSSCGSSRAPSVIEDTDDVDTPHQSMINRAAFREQEKVSLDDKLTVSLSRLGAGSAILLALIVTMISLLGNLTQQTLDPLQQLALRREALSSALADASNISHTQVTRAFNLDHLLPSPTEHETAPAHYQGVYPNLIVVSLTRQPQHQRFPRPSKVSAHRDGKPIQFNYTKLVDGVYQFAVDKQYADGPVLLEILTRDPALNVSISHDFGGHLLQRTYERALSRNVDIAKRVRAEVQPSYRATREVTKNLALQMVKDVQLFSSNTIALFGNATNSGVNGVNKAARYLRDHTPSRQTLNYPLILSQQRALQLRDTAKSSLCKHFRTRQTKLENRISSFKHLARCSFQTGNIKECKDEIEARNKAVSALSVVSGYNAIAKFYESSSSASKNDVTSDSGKQKQPNGKHHTKGKASTCRDSERKRKGCARSGS